MDEDKTPFQRWYEKNKEKHKENVRQRKASLHEFVDDLRRSAECERCGESHPATLEFHHTDETEYDLRLRTMANEGYSRENIQAEFDRGMMVCRNCHAKIHYDADDHPWAGS